MTDSKFAQERPLGVLDRDRGTPYIRYRAVSSNEGVWFRDWIGGGGVNSLRVVEELSVSVHTDRVSH